MAQSISSAHSKGAAKQTQISISAAEPKEHLEKWTKKSRRKAGFPRRFKAKLVALHYFQIAFVAGETYNEPQVNAAIQRGNIFDLDHVQIRRYLVDYGMLNRSPDGRMYQLSDAYLSLAQWDPIVLAKQQTEIQLSKSN